MIGIAMIIICIAPLIYLLIHQFIQMKTDLKEWEQYLEKEKTEVVNENLSIKDRIIELKKQIEINEAEIEENKLELNQLVKELNNQIKDLQELKNSVKDK